MIFNSIFFFITLAGFFGLYFFIKKKRSVSAKIVTLAYSYFFYGMWNAAFLILIVASTLIDYWVARLMEAYPSRKKTFVSVSLISNLGLLGFFKYFNFFVDSLWPLIHVLGLEWTPPALEVSLPVGISFYTFQTLSYSIDVYRGKISAESSLLDIAVYVAFFPQLVAGPIVRASHFLPQLKKEPLESKKDLMDGATLVLTGLFMKVVIADNVASRVNMLFDSWHFNGIMENWAAALLFGIQIYGDFSGYSLIAIGLAKIMGFSIPENFNAPYAASGFSDFWRRWHISLSSWLRDYLYISLGGNRKGRGRTYLNIMITMLLGGLWHGASIMFVLWGALHGLYLCVERFVKSQVQKYPMTRGALKPILSGLGIFFTYIVVSLTWIPFRATHFEQGLTMMRGLFEGRFHLNRALLPEFLFIFLVFLCSCAARRWDVLKFIRSHNKTRFLWVNVVLLSLYFFSGERTQFIYFQF